MEPIRLKFSGRLAPHHYQMALYLHYRPHRFIELAQPLILVGYLSAILLHGVKYMSAASMTVLTFPLFILAIWRVVFFDSQVRASFFRDASLSDRYEFQVTATKLYISSIRGELVFDWSDFSHYKRNRSLTLLYRSETEFYLFPDGWFESMDDAHWFHEHLHGVLGVPLR